MTKNKENEAITEAINLLVDGTIKQQEQRFVNY